MSARIHCITLPVNDLRTAATFYRDGLGMPAPSDAEFEAGVDHVAIELEDGMYLVLIERAAFEPFATRANLSVAPPNHAECVLSYFAQNREEVDAILAQVANAGGAVNGAPKSEVWGYAGFVTDPDGHLWEIMFNEGLSG